MVSEGLVVGDETSHAKGSVRRDDPGGNGKQVVMRGGFWDEYGG